MVNNSNRMYVLDTNVLLYDPQSPLSFSGASVGIPIIVLEELDRFKSERSERGHSARESIRFLDSLRDKGSLRDGVILENGCTLRVLFLPEDEESIDFPMAVNVGDNAILLTALYWKDKGYNVQFISKDINARVKADVLGISAQDYQKGHVSEKKFYRGWKRIEVPAVSLKSEFPEELFGLVEEKELLLNEFVYVASRNNPYNYKIFRYLGNSVFKTVEHPKLKWPLEARNPEQLMALDLLFDPQVQLITLFGQAGTGKTFMALLAGLHKVLVDDEYEKLLISRPVVPLGQDIGYLPGTLEEKLHSWMQPIYDNMEFILHSVQLGRFTRFHKEEAEYGRKQKKGHGKKKKKEKTLVSIEELMKQGKISLEAITYMRGRSIPYQYILIDEVQNLTPHEVKTLISRVGEGSKIILSGDPYQIDSPYLDFTSNGLLVASNKFKGQRIFGSVFLQHSERSQLSKLVGELW